MKIARFTGPTVPAVKLLMSWCWCLSWLLFISHAQGAEVSSAPARTPVTNDQPLETSTFGVYEFQIEGNTVLPGPLVERTVMPFMGPNKRIADLEAARSALEQLYQRLGYLSVYVELPDQEVDSGVAVLKVVEGKVGRLKVSGSRYHSQEHIRRTVTELAPGKVPNFAVVQTQLADVNRTEERRVQPVIKPGYEVGTVEAELQVTDELPLQMSLELNNRQAQFTEPWRTQATLRYTNLWQTDHALSVTAITTPQDLQQSKVLAMSYTAPLTQGDAWLGILVLSDSLVEPLGAANVVGKGLTVGIRRLWSLPSASGFQHSLSFGADYKDLQERIDAGGSSLSSPLRYVPFKLAYNASWQSDETVSTLSLGGVFSLRGVVRRSVDCAGTGVVNQFACKREGGDGSFAAFTIEAAHNRPLGQGRFQRWQLRGRLAGQITGQPLVGPEQFSVGGADSVRGYYEAEAVGDLGAHAALEVRSPNLRGALTDATTNWLDEAYWHAFVDAGFVRTKNPGNALERTSLAASGMGLRLRVRKALSAQVDIAWPMRATDATEKHDPRAHMRLGLDF